VLKSDWKNHLFCPNLGPNYMLNDTLWWDITEKFHIESTFCFGDMRGPSDLAD